VSIAVLRRIQFVLYE